MTLLRSLLLLLVAAAAAPALAARHIPTGLHVVRLGGGGNDELYKGHHSFMSPFFRAFVHNQKKGFPFPNGKECEEDSHRLCGGILRRCVGRFGCSMQCMTDHAPELSEKCRKAHPCYVDIDKFCPHVGGGRNAMMDCLHGHLKDLSAQCKKHHPCLVPGQHLCHKLDYNTPPVNFIGQNVAKFLEKVRSGAFAHAHHPPAGGHHGFFHPGGFSRNHHQHSFRRFKDRMHREREAEKHVEREERELLAERRELASERRELEQERRRFARERDGLPPAHHGKSAAAASAASAGAGWGSALTAAGVLALVAVGGAAAWKWHSGRSAAGGFGALNRDSHAL